MLMTWPPPYEVRRHRLARSVKLRAEPRGLVITVPFRFNMRDLPSIIDAHKDWIEKHVVISPCVSTSTLPTQVTAHAIKQTWYIVYEHAETPLRRRERADGVMVLSGDIADTERCLKILSAWLLRLSKTYLTQRFNELSQQIGLPYKGLTIRTQKTRWGSCSSQHAINLNSKLFFVPPAVADYVMIHELCHTKHMNHSKRFWVLVERFDPNWKVHRRVLREGDNYIPRWLLK